MNSGLDTQDSLRNSPQSAREDLGPEDLHVTQSSILYLLQEATKLASPADQHSLDAKGIHDNSKVVSASSCSSASLSQKSQKVINSKTQPSLTGVLSVLSSVQASSPWEVMSLINLQCERLLHSGQSHGEEEGPCIHTTKTDSLKLISDNTEAEYVNSMECSSFPSDVVLDTSTTNMSLTRDSAKHDVEPNVWFSMAHIVDGTNQVLVNQTQDNISAKSKAIEDLAELIAENPGDTSSSASMVHEECNKMCFHVETSALPLVAKKVNLCDLPPTQLTFHQVEGQGKITGALSLDTPQRPVPEIRSIDFTSSLVIEKDGDSSMCFTFNTYENPQPEVAVISKTASQVIGSSPCRTDLNNNQDDDDDNEKPQEPGEAMVVSSTQATYGNYRRTPRKQAHPARSPDLQDPELQGVTFSMHTELDHSTDQCRLLITSNYRRGRRSRGSRSRSMQSSQRARCLEEESDPASASKKMCASCCTRKTPLWRDAEDGTPLCNACGIRYKKYRVRCLQCWNIPRKEANSNSKCLKCGDVLQLASQNKRAGW